MLQPVAPSQPLATAWDKFKLFLSRAVFWSYERGSWQYDVICAVILIFIFFTPRSWFHDRPTLELTDLRHRQGVIEIGRTRAGSEYLVDSRLVESLAPLKTEDAVRNILEGRLNRSITIKSIDPVLDKNNVMLGYTVVVSP
ncbi:MAG TPA: hypothetical protein VI455_04460 [Terriglobia bacterium]